MKVSIHDVVRIFVEERATDASGRMTVALDIVDDRGEIFSIVLHQLAGCDTIKSDRSILDAISFANGLKIAEAKTRLGVTA